MASASLPGVFEANRLMVKDADGFERYESTGGMGMHFQDGSMEADLPMQQLSEMFNINHFIISQAVSWLPFVRDITSAQSISLLHGHAS